ncbi:beta-N-acetylhexosaminidase [Sphingomonas sp. LaA6.9]|uniref:beta-N-acetylhexosaminidase n=1 Tax=Sphingomonas sp. LaA6.9 TaxID=2919914 RepID=UPI001F4F863E|nr:beta-N-acetylhexosaminidase [Sphingomonas sp. LaA6.9]MCJ8159202.1 beta-N-acetylhexosaminidase [Sphingomonas sp. LaA6.9]
MKPVIFGLSGEVLTADERSFFRDADPAGYILFKRNVVDRDQVRRLTDELRSIDGRDDLPILIDQEGGRVARMQPPVWPKFPAGEPFGALYEKAPASAIEAARANAEAIALTLSEVGITVDCLPLLDVRQQGASDVIGDRSFGSDPMRVAALGRAVLDGLRRGGCVGVVKHMPGHGRALVDSHLKLPVVEASDDELEIDIAPFRTLKDAPMGMSAHIVYKAWDPERPATLSPIVIEKIIRGRIGFDGLLMTDDIDMKALSGRTGEKASAAVAAGCDLVLDCWGRMDEMIDIAGALDEIRPESRARLDRAMATIAGDPKGDFAALVEKRDALLAYA